MKNTCGIKILIVAILLMSMALIPATATQSKDEGVDNNSPESGECNVVYMLRSFLCPISLEELNKAREEVLGNYRKENNTIKSPMIYSQPHVSQDERIVAFGFLMHDDGTTSQYVGIAGSERDVPKIHDGAKIWYDREISELGEAGNRAVTTYGSAEVTSWTASGKRELTPEELAKINADLPEEVFFISGLEVPSRENSLPGNASVKDGIVATAGPLPGDEQDSVPQVSKKAPVFNMSMDNAAYNWNRINHEFPLLKMIFN
jgi:hypothetical protein